MMLVPPRARGSPHDGDHRAADGHTRRLLAVETGAAIGIVDANGRPERTAAVPADSRIDVRGT
jgi:hypothetical protein